MTLTVARKDRLRAATEDACKALTRDMSRAQLQARLDEVTAKLKSSTGFDGKPMRGLSERARACKAEIARLETEIAASH